MTAPRKRHDPTQKKLDDARRKGEVPRSLDLAAAAGYVGLLICFWALGEPAGDADRGKPSEPHRECRAADPARGWRRREPGRCGPRSPRTIGILAGWFLIPGLFVVLALLAQRGFAFSPEKAQPKLSRHIAHSERQEENTG